MTINWEIIHMCMHEFPKFCLKFKCTLEGELPLHKIVGKATILGWTGMLCALSKKPPAFVDAFPMLIYDFNDN